MKLLTCEKCGEINHKGNIQLILAAQELIDSCLVFKETFEHLKADEPCSCPAGCWKHGSERVLKAMEKLE